MEIVYQTRFLKIRNIKFYKLTYGGYDSCISKLALVYWNFQILRLTVTHQTLLLRFTCIKIDDILSDKTRLLKFASIKIVDILSFSAARILKCQDFFLNWRCFIILDCRYSVSLRLTIFYYFKIGSSDY